MLYLAAVPMLAGGLSGGLYQWLIGLGFTALGFGEFTFRLAQVFAIAGCIPLLAALHLQGWRAWGLRLAPGFTVHLLRGLLLGIVTLGIICALLLVLEIRVIRPDLITAPEHWVDVVVSSALAAALIALIEEAWFRGALQTLMTRLFSVTSAVVVIAAFYAAAHFLRPAGVVDMQPVGNWSGFTALWSALAGFPLLDMSDSLAALFIAGVLLGVLRVRHGNVAMCIGVHTGWVFVIKVYKKFTYINPPADFNALVGHYDGVLGWLAAVLLLLFTLVLWWSGRFRGAPTP